MTAKPRIPIVFLAATATVLAISVPPAGAALASGGLDPTFARSGRLTVPQTPKADPRYGERLADVLRVGSGGSLRVVTAGYFSPAGPSSGDAGGFVTVRGYRANGSVDPRFNKGKPRILLIVSRSEGPNVDLESAGIDAAGRVYLATAWADALEPSIGRAYRLTASGQVDRGYRPEWGGDLPPGLPDDGGSPEGRAVAFRPLANGTARACMSGWEATYVLGYTAAGTLDPTYGTGEAPGIAVLAGAPTCWGMSVDGAGGVVLTGARLDPSGRPVPGWGDGRVYPPGLEGSVYNWRTATSKAGQAYLTGVWRRSGRPDQPVVLRLTATGSIDPAFGSGGVATYANPAGGADLDNPALAFGASDSMYLTFTRARYGSRGGYVLKVRRSTGALVTSFGTGGRVSVTRALAGDVVVQPLTTSRILLGYSASRSPGTAGGVVEKRRS